MSKYDVIPVSVDDYQKKAKKRLPNFLFDYIEGGANAEETLHLNTILTVFHFISLGTHLLSLSEYSVAFSLC